MIKLSEKQQSYLLKGIDLTLPFGLLYLLAHLMNLQWHDRYLIIGVVATIMLYGISKIKDLYKPLTEQNLFQNAVSTMGIWLLILTVSITIAFFYNDAQNFSRKLLITWLFLTPIALIIIKALFKSVVHKKNTHILVIGNQYTFTLYELERLQKAKISLYNLQEHPDKETLIKQINDTLQKQTIHKIVLNSEQTDAKVIRYYVQQELKGIRFYTFEHFMEKFLRKCYIPTEHQPLKYLDEIQPYNNKQKLIKAIFDYTSAITLIAITLPIMIYAIYRIKKESPGSIIFKQPRTGINGKEFTAYKFRSMHEDSYFNPYTQKEDPRIFPFGKTMRKTRIDELLQAINILKGNMSLVGPRAEWNILSGKYLEKIPFYEIRNLVKPGITGWAQVNYPYGATLEDTRQKLMYDLYYIKYWSLALEIETAWKTIEVIFRKQGI